MCWLFHKWGKWEFISSESFGITFRRTVQKRICEHCGKVEVSDKIK